MKTWLLTVVFSTAVAAQTMPPRDAPATRATGTAIVRGRITAAATSQPLHRVRVTLNGSQPNPLSAVTDTRGEFEITSVPAGSYSITAARAGYLTIQYGQRQPREAGRTVEIRDDEVVDRIDIALHRGGVLAGSMADELGDPYPAVRVEAVEIRYLRGRRMPLQAGSTATNDRGEFRLSGLQPGTYMLRASATETWPGDDMKDTFAYATTYYPGVTGTDQAQRVSVGVGQTLSNLAFSLRVGHTARITGALQNASGEPMALQTVNLDRATRGVGGALSSLSRGASPVRTDQSGSFTFQDLAPGEYVVYSGGETERARAAVIVADGDVRRVVVTPRKPSSIAGTVVTDDGTRPPFPAARVRVAPIAADPESVLPSFGGPNPATVGPDWTFRIANMDGQYLFRTEGLPGDWMLAAVSLGGRDITDTPLPVAAGGVDTSGLQIAISRKGGTISGQVVDRDGTPAPDSTVVVFAADPAKWTVASRFVKAGRPDNAGRFTIAGLPPGVYRAIAREFVADGQWEDPEFLTSATPNSVRLELNGVGPATLTLKLEPPR